MGKLGNSSMLSAPARAATVGFALALALSPAFANQPKSQFTTIELKSCTIAQKHRDGNVYSCPGLDGYPVYYAVGDERTFLSVGPDARKRRAASQTLPEFNSIFRGKGSRATLEWRIAPKSGKPVPYATILRYFTSANGHKGEVLVVSKVTEKESCHVAYVNALGNPGAIAVARRIADTAARQFDCRNEPAEDPGRGPAPQ